MDSLTLDEITDTVCNTWGDVTDKQRGFVRKNISVANFKKGEIIYDENERPRNMLYLLSGKIKIEKEGVSNPNQIVRVIKPKGMFGFRAYFANQTYETRAIAFEQASAAIIPLNIIEKLINDNSDVAMYFVRDLCVKLGDADQRTINLTQKHIRARLAETILLLKEIYGVEDDGRTLSVLVSREDTANMSNMTTSNAIRTLSSFADEKLIAIKGRRVKILNEDELRDISEKG